MSFCVNSPHTELMWPQKPGKASAEVYSVKEGKKTPKRSLQEKRLEYIRQKKKKVESEKDQTITFTCRIFFHFPKNPYFYTAKSFQSLAIIKNLNLVFQSYKS